MYKSHRKQQGYGKSLLDKYRHNHRNRTCNIKRARCTFGAWIAQTQGFADVNSGSGMIVIGLASVIIGEVIFGKRSLSVGLVSAVISTVIYRMIVAFALETKMLGKRAKAAVGGYSCRNAVGAGH